MESEFLKDSGTFERNHNVMSDSVKVSFKEGRNGEKIEPQSESSQTVERDRGRKRGECS